VDADEFNTRIALAAEAVPELIDNYIKGADDPETHQAFVVKARELLGTTFADVLSLLVALAEYAADKAGLEPNADPDNPDHAYIIRIFDKNGNLRDINQEPPAQVWSTRFMAAVWSNDTAQVDALFHVFVTAMDSDAQGDAIRAVINACAQVVLRAQQQKEGDT